MLCFIFSRIPGDGQRPETQRFLQLQIKLNKEKTRCTRNINRKFVLKQNRVSRGISASFTAAGLHLHSNKRLSFASTKHGQMFSLIFVLPRRYMKRYVSAFPHATETIHITSWEVLIPKYWALLFLSSILNVLFPKEHSKIFLYRESVPCVQQQVTGWTHNLKTINYQLLYCYISCNRWQSSLSSWQTSEYEPGVSCEWSSCDSTH
jgi:hypothetical protein